MPALRELERGEEVSEVRDAIKCAMNRPKAPSYFFIYTPWMRKDINIGWFAGVLLVDMETGERDFSMFGTHADEFKKRWEDYDKQMTTSPYGLPLKIDLPGVNAPDWIEEEGDEPDER